MKSRFRIACLLMLVFALLWLGWNGLHNQLVLVNRSGQSIALMQITIDKESLTFNDVPDGKEVAATFQTQGANPVVLKGRLEDGMLVSGHYSFVPNGWFGERIHLVVKRNGMIDIDQKQNTQ